MKRLTKNDLPTTLGAFNPVGHVMVGLPREADVQAACQRLREAGFADEDLLDFAPEVGEADMGDLADQASPVSGFGYEIVLMKRYIKLSREGYRWLLVYAPGDDQAQRLQALLPEVGATVAVKYHRLASEDLI